MSGAGRITFRPPASLSGCFLTCLNPEKRPKTGRTTFHSSLMAQSHPGHRGFLFQPNFICLRSIDGTRRQAAIRVILRVPVSSGRESIPAANEAGNAIQPLTGACSCYVPRGKCSEMTSRDHLRAPESMSRHPSLLKKDGRLVSASSRSTKGKRTKSRIRAELLCAGEVIWNLC